VFLPRHPPRPAKFLQVATHAAADAISAPHELFRVSLVGMKRINADTKQSAQRPSEAVNRASARLGAGCKPGCKTEQLQLLLPTKRYREVVDFFVDFELTGRPWTEAGVCI
jgi:hypothetical protein